MKAYSTDLRERAVNSVERGECTIPEAARRYQVSEPSLERWLARQRTTGSCAPLPHVGGVARKLAAAETAIRDAVHAQPEATLHGLCERVEQDTTIESDPSMMCRELARLKLPRKKVTPRQSAGYAARETTAHPVSARSRGAGGGPVQVSR